MIKLILKLSTLGAVISDLLMDVSMSFMLWYQKAHLFSLQSHRIQKQVMDILEMAGCEVMLKPLLTGPIYFYEVYPRTEVTDLKFLLKNTETKLLVSLYIVAHWICVQSCTPTSILNLVAILTSHLEQRGSVTTVSLLCFIQVLLNIIRMLFCKASLKQMEWLEWYSPLVPLAMGINLGALGHGY